MEKNKKKLIYLWFGEDTFTIHEKLKEKKNDFEKKFGDFNISEIDWICEGVSENEKLSRLQNGLMSNSLFSSSRMFVIRNMFFSSKKKNGSEKELEKSGGEKEKIVLNYLKNPSESAVIFFIEETLDQRKKFYKELLRLSKESIAEIKEYLTPVNYEFDKWLQTRIEKGGGKIKKDALNILAISLGKGLSQKDKNKRVILSYDLWEAGNEVDKLVSFCKDKDITKEDIELLVRSKVDMNIFNLIDSISAKSKNKAIFLLHAQIEKGSNEIYIFTMLVRQFRNLLVIKNLLEQNLTSPEIAIKTRINPYVVSKTVQQCQNFKIENLKKIYMKLYDADVAIKTGKMDAGLALDLLVVSMI